jgi:hypothetical protein
MKGLGRALLVSILALGAGGPVEGQGGPAGIAAWDTGQTSKDPLPPAAIAAKTGWTAIADAGATVKGDLVLSNGRIVAVFRRHDGSIDLYDPAARRARLVLQTAAGDPIASVDRLLVAEAGRGGGAVEVSGKTVKGASVSARFRLKRGDVSLEAQPGAGTGRLRLECPTRYVVLPDFFADDILIDAARIPVASAEIPSENFLLHFAGTGDALVVAVFENREQDVRVDLSGQGAERRIAASRIEFGAGKKIWVALLAEPRVWHAVEVRAEDAKKVMPLDWTMPFLASWRCDMMRPNDLADSWDMLLQHKKGQEYVKPAWLGGPAEQVNDATRRRFTEVLGFFPYPVWSDPERKGYLQPLELETRTKFVSTLSYRGPAVLYPFNRVPETPADRFTVVDVARNALGVGPCEYILDLEGQKQEYKGMATCNARDALEAIYKKGEQKQKKAEILKILDDTHAFVVHIRARIAAYVEFGLKVRAYLGEQKKARPDLAGEIDELDRLAREIDARVTERADRIKTPADVARMNDDFRKNLLENQGADAHDRVKAYGEALTKIGGNQDKLVSECRWVVRTLRQQAAILVTREPGLAPVSAEIRARTQAVLKNPSQHERARQ